MLLRKSNLYFFLKKYPLTLICVILLSCTSFSQNEDKFIKKGRKDYTNTCISFSKAIELGFDPNMTELSAIKSKCNN